MPDYTSKPYFQDRISQLLWENKKRAERGRAGEGQPSQSKAFITNIPEEVETARREGFEPGKEGQNLIYVEPAETIKNLTPETKNMMLQANTYRKLNPDAPEEEVQEFLKYVHEKEIKGKPKKKYTAKNITDYYGKHAYDKDGNFTGLTENQEATLRYMLGDTDAQFHFKETEIPAQREEKKWGWDVGEPNIPARKAAMLVPYQEMMQPSGTMDQSLSQPMPQMPTQPQQPMQPQQDRLQMSDEQIKKILKQNGYATTAENIVRFRSQN